MTPGSSSREREHDVQGFGTKVSFDAINEVGTYVCNWSGHLLRAPADAICPGRSPLMTLSGKEPLYVTKINDDPYVPVSKARLLAAEADLIVNF